MTKTDAMKLAKRTKKTTRKLMKKKLQLLQQANLYKGHGKKTSSKAGILETIGTLIVLVSVAVSIIRLLRPKAHHLDAEERQHLFETE